MKKNKPCFNMFLLSFIALAALIILLPASFALGIGSMPNQRTVLFEPNKQVVFTYMLTSSDTNVKVYVSGDLSEFVSVSRDIIPAQDNDKSFKVTIQFPDKIISPGTHKMSVVAEQMDASSGGSFGTKVNIRLNFDVFVPYPGKYVELAVSAPNVDINETAAIIVKASNKGLETINGLYSDIFVFNITGAQVAYFKTESVNLKSQASKEFTVLLDTKSLSSGEYTVAAEVDYPGLNKTTAKFRIGSQKVILADYTKKFMIDTINKFEINIINDWNIEVSNVYAEILVEGKSFKTPVVVLAPWQLSKVEGYLDAQGMSTGSKNASITLHYAGKEVKEDVVLEFTERIIEKPAPIQFNFFSQGNITFILIGITALLIIITVILMFKVHKPESIPKEDEIPAKKEIVKEPKKPTRTK